METLEPVVNNYARWLAHAAKLGFNFYYEQLLPILKTWDRVLSYMRPQNEIYQRGCAIFQRCIEPMIWTALALTGIDYKSQGESEFPAVLQPMFIQFKGYLANLEAVTNEIVGVINEVEGKLKTRSYRLTEDEKYEVEMLLMDVEAKSEQFNIFFKKAQKTLKCLSSEVESYRREQGVSGWNVFLSVAAGVGLGGLGVALLPVVSPAVACYGGGVIGGIGGYLYAGKVNDDEYEMLRVQIAKQRSRLETLETRFETKEPLIHKLKKQVSNVRITGGFRGEI
ncbi:uncharacterized protein [Acropora muricata]|uniref:uncharacterized protein n=1 Tax=Acropora muricata TaxID=159855 RepID=UPI0034E3BED3